MEERSSCKITFEIFLLPEYWNEKNVTTDGKQCVKNKERNGYGVEERQKEKKGRNESSEGRKSRSRWLRGLRRGIAVA